ncbi:MAG: hypothetical protein P4M09_17325 [Devosia sp.]|nr:hypothetical protein [Devosia sp.]
MNKLVSIITAFARTIVTAFRATETDFAAKAQALVNGFNTTARSSEAKAEHLYDLAAQVAATASSHNRKAQDARFVANRIDEVING